MAQDGQHIFGIVVKKVFPRVLHDFHHFFTCVLDISLVDIIRQCLELGAQGSDERAQEEPLVRHRLSGLRGQNRERGPNAPLMLLIAEFYNLISERLNVH